MMVKQRGKNKATFVLSRAITHFLSQFHIFGVVVHFVPVFELILVSI